MLSINARSHLMERVKNGLGGPKQGGEVVRRRVVLQYVQGLRISIDGDLLMLVTGKGEGFCSSYARLTGFRFAL